MPNTTLASRIASALYAAENCRRNGNEEWRAKHLATARSLTRSFMPSGAGIDNGTSLYDRATPDRLVFGTSFHHMTDGMYNGWTDHVVTARASLVFGLDVSISGRDRNEIKDYLAECFLSALRRELSTTECAHCYAQ